MHITLNGHLTTHRLVGLVVKASASRVEDPGFESPFVGIYPGSSHTSDLKNSRVFNQNGVSLLYIMLEIHHSGREPSKSALQWLPCQCWDWLALCQYTVTG